MKRWIVQSGDEGTLAELIARAFGDKRAIAEGRVFVGRRRAKTGDELVRVGDEIAMAPALPISDAALLADEGDLVAADKPAGVPTIPDHGGGAHTLLAAVARSLGVSVSTLHATSRLDRDVSGVVVFARTADAAARLRRARDAGEYRRRYVAIAARAPTPERGTWDAPIGRARDPRHRAAFGRDAVPAFSRYAVVARAGECALLALTPETGRTHQLRVHASHAGAALMGDRIYHGPSSITLPSGQVVAIRRVALHAGRVTVPRRDGASLVIESPVPHELTDVWRVLGGQEGAFGQALSSAP